MWSVGQLAKATGLTVRTLHHYEAVGLLTPSERGENGYRRYEPADVERLYRIVALRELGLPLKAIGGVLDGGDPRSVMEQHLAHVESELRRHRRLRDRLKGLLAGDSTELVQLIQETVMHEQYYTEEQMQQLAERREALGEDGMQRVQAEWAELIEAMRREHEAGTDPSDPRVRELGLPLKSIGAVLDGGDARTVMEQHLAFVEAELRRHRRLRDRLRALLAAGGSTDPELIKEMTMHEQYYSEEQLEQLAARRDALGEEGMAKAQQDWADVIADANAALAAGADPTSEEVQAIVARWDGLVEQFTGGDPGIRQSLGRMYSAEGVEKASRGAVSVELQEFLGRARAAR